MSTPPFTANLKSLECFRAIIVTGSATAAARHLGLTQPAVSRMLAVLEAAVGFELFHRRKGRLVPTDDALALHREVDIALQSVDRVSRLARNLRNEDFGALSIVSPPSFAEGILSRVIAEFIAGHPNLRVILDSQSVEIARDMVALRAVDCGFVKLPVDYPGLSCMPLLRAGTVCALPPDHPLREKQSLSVEDLHQQPLILLGHGRASRRQIDDAFQAAGATMNVRIETHTVGAACAFARSGLGIAIVNEMLAVLYAASGIELRRLEPDFVHEYAFMTSADAPMTRVTRRFLEHCEAYFARHQDDFRLQPPPR